MSFYDINLDDLTPGERLRADTALAALPERWRAMFEARLAGRTFTHIAEHHGISAGRVRQIVLQATRRVCFAARSEQVETGAQGYWLSLGLPVRAANCLHNAGVTSLAELAQVSPDDLMHTPDFGKASLASVSKLLVEHGYRDPVSAMRNRADPLLLEARKLVAELSASKRYADDTLAGWNDKSGIVTHTLAGIRRGMELRK